MAGLLIDALAQRIVEEDVSFRTHMLEIAAGLEDVIALGRGDPDFHTPQHIVQAAKAALDQNQHHYTHPAGLLPLREAIADTLHRDHGLNYSRDEIIVTAGVQESIMLVMLGLVNPGDEVLITSPRFTTYDMAVSMCGGVPVPVPTYEEDDFALMPAAIEARITPQTKALVLVTPNNPTGAVTPPAVIREIADLVKRHKIVLYNDEINALAALTGPQDAVQAMLEEYAERRTYLMGALSEMGMSFGHPGGAFYIYTNVSSTGLPSPRFCEELLRQGRVMIFPGSMFGDDSDKYVRISYLQPLSRIKEAVDRMRGFIRTR